MTDTDSPNDMTKATLHQSAARLGQLFLRRGLMLTVAESCTGGAVGAAITSISGSSAWFDCGFVTYSNLSKQLLLGVRAKTLEQFGAVSEQTAREMAQGALARSRAQVSVAVTGIAGPEGGTERTPVGTVWLAWAGHGKPTQARVEHFSGDREGVRSQAVQAALQGLIDAVEQE